MSNFFHKLNRDKRNALGLRRKRIVLSILVAIGQLPLATLAAPDPSPSPAPDPSPQQVEFSSSFLGAGASNYDVTRFERGNPVLPGDYRVDLYVNQNLVSREQVSFREVVAGGEARACFNRRLLVTMGVDTAKLEAAGTNLDNPCIDLAALIADASVQFDTSELRLDVSIPQVALNRNARGYVDPKLWDRGMNAFTLGYNFNASQADRDLGAGSEQAYLGLNAGLNLGGWRIRNQSNYRWNHDGGSDFQNISTYAQHDVTRWQSQLTVGDAFTTGELFDSVGFRGVNLATDNRMRPESMNGYAPIVRGTADTHAKVEIRQNGYVIYETTVAPGAFEIDDLYATGYGGDLEVTVTEADGRQRSFSVPYAAVPQLLRPGTWRYSASAGRLRADAFEIDAPYFIEGTYQRGFNNWLTGYVGSQITDAGLYRNLLLGAAFSTPVGAVSVDLTGSQTHFSLDGGDQSGYSARVTYSKSIPSTRTDFALAAYRYSSKGFLSLNDAATLDDAVRSGPLAGGVVEGAGSQRSRFQFTLSQNLGSRAGSLHISGSRNDYWDGFRPVDTSYQVGWNNRYRDLSYGLSASRSRVVGGDYDNRYFLTLSFPFGNNNQRSRAPQFTLGATHAPEGNTVQAGVTGTAGDHGQYNYGVNGNFGNDNHGSIGVGAGWRAAYANLGASYSYAQNSRQVSYTANGGLVIHRGGITFASQLGDTIGVIEAKGASGARLSSDGASKVDGRGYAVASSLMPYRINDVMLDPKGTSLDVELQTSRVQAIPRAGAVVPLKFDTVTGHAVLLQARLQDGSVVPFGAQVLDAQGNDVGIVGQGGQVFVRYPDENRGQLKVNWGGGQGNQQCTLDYQPSADAKGTNDVAVVKSVCRG
ncbi:outer membrane usher protein [Lysobacter niastensis]|uniref:Outer membrane usher protein n=1 Tax=Lysobacter niastensis TaxID=380629 RepID=A0ABU1WBK8_9GAMM|nr:fimbria/pilus outer membrane usher protein [Lysobacter niastensis]MDR7135012.1 outer membrane usher protein [Lysobacter niastensis]